MNISIFGLGYVGSVSLACLARDGHTVIGVDINPSKLELISSGKSPVIEEGMPELMKSAWASGRVSVTTDVEHAVLNSDVSFIALGTPSNRNGSQDQKAVLSLTGELGAIMARKTGHHTFVYRSTLLPGTIDTKIRPLLEETSGKKDGTEFDLCFQPEFLREGSSIRDYDHPPFTVVGATSERALEVMRSLFGHLPAAFHGTSIRTAEMVKACCNNFHALKITFANETARLCEAIGCDPFEVMNLVCQDRQLNISPAYLRPGFAFGGSCLPKDLRSTLYTARMTDVELPMLGAVLPSNDIHIRRVIDKVLYTGKKRVGMIGLSFKTGTDDLRESALVTLAEQLIAKGLELTIFDPEVNLAKLVGANRQYIEETIPHIGSLLTGDCAALVASSDVIVAGINNPEVVECLMANVRPGQVLIDLVRIPDVHRLPVKYIGACW